MLKSLENRYVERKMWNENTLSGFLPRFFLFFYTQSHTCAQTPTQSIPISALQCYYYSNFSIDDLKRITFYRSSPFSCCLSAKSAIIKESFVNLFIHSSWQLRSDFFFCSMCKCKRVEMKNNRLPYFSLLALLFAVVFIENDRH